MATSTVDAISLHQFRTPAAEERYIIDTPVSPKRTQAFLHSYGENREKAATVEALFRRVGALHREPQWNDGAAYGFNVLLLKGPFVEGANWAPYSTWEFAVAAQRHLLDQFELLLRESVPGLSPPTAPRSARGILSRFSSLTQQARAAGVEPSLLVITGPVDAALRVDFFEHGVRRPLSKELLGPWIIGLHQQIPLLHIPEAPRAALYVVDLPRFAQLIQFGTGPQFQIEEFTRERALQVISQNPDIVTLPVGTPDTTDQRVKRLLLHVGLELHESSKIERRGPGAARGAPIAFEESASSF